MLTRRLTLAVAVLPAAASAQGTFPDAPVRMIIPFPPGGPADLIARLLGRSMGERLGQPVVVESRSGAGGAIGVDAAAKARPDGQTIVLASTGALVVLPHMMARMAYGPLRELSPICHVLSVPQVLVVRRGGAADVAVLVAQAKAAPGRLTFGSAGNGSSLHLAGELFKLRTGADITHVPYRGAAPALTDLLGGSISMMLADVPVVLPGIRSGDLVALAVTAAARNPALPSVPTMAEAGVTGAESETWYALFGPAGVPADRVARLHRAAAESLAEPELRRGLEEQGGAIVGSTPEQLAATLRSEHAKWGEIVRLSGARLE
ncbi:Bug family tripartite tricarboxylate transporter substrate binding protein [Roseomonas sp. CCTCC AB2023176]|uniref:Bug family tripartite tricarboxylate transporter substrate binding protein n=1 Tax=Roseomonas sp. CCTCC AB2023176 TaxID=3342640 RepID=UPI0035DAAC88